MGVILSLFTYNKSKKNNVDKMTVGLVIWTD